MKNIRQFFSVIIVIICVSVVTAQEKQPLVDYLPIIPAEAMISIPVESQNKVLSGKLVQRLSQKKFLYEKGLIDKSKSREIVAIYLSEHPTEEEINILEQIGVECHLDTWTPPLKNHPFGFFLALLPYEKFQETISKTFIKKIDTAEYENEPHNNNATASINVNNVWTDGYDGTGIKVGVLDSGIDPGYDGNEFPAAFERMDYSAYPTIDPGVNNTVTGHGTHVAGTVLARGTNSIGRIDDGNGASPFKGAAPDADLLFLKIGSDASGGASSAAMIAAMDAGVSMYNADILTMSYGGWYTYHDGSSTTEQKVDWVYNQGVPFFISAGNSGDDDHHYSGTVAANSSTGFIAINAENFAGLSFNLVWYDGLGTNNDLFLEYYNTSQVKYTTDVIQNITTESTRGTESKYSWYYYTVPAGTYYLKVVNNSANSQFFHIYFYRQTTPQLTFVNSDPFYTIGQPASADDGFAVGSYVSRDLWVSSTGGGPYWYGASFVLDGIAPYSSRGPRVNNGIVKPNITAPGSAIISVRDTDVLTIPNSGWIDNDGTTGAGGANYYVMTGTSMACPMAAGAAALLLDKNPSAAPQQVYDAITNSASNSGTGTLPNNTWGFGKLDALAASNDTALPVELTSFTATLSKTGIKLKWITALEINNYGFDIERKITESSNWQKIGFVDGNGNSNSVKQYTFVDNGLTGGNNFNYRLKQIDTDGKFKYSDIVSVTSVPAKFELAQNYPNPFNPSTTIKFSLIKKSNVQINLINTLGEKVAELINGNLEAGVHKVEFNAHNLPSGIYFYTINVEGKFSDTKKMLLMK